MSIVELKNLSNDDIKKMLASQIDIEDWMDECGNMAIQDYYMRNCIVKQHVLRSRNCQTFSKRTRRNIERASNLS